MPRSGAEGVYSMFADATVNNAFVDQGYVVLPLLSTTEVEHLRGIFAAMHPHELAPFYVTTTPATTLEYRREVYESIRSIVEPKLESFFTGFRIGAAVFFAKEPGQRNSDLPMHVDPCYVDERRNPAVTFWSPLVDVDTSNGCLKVVPGSHHYVGPLRPYGDWMGIHPFQEVHGLLTAAYTKNIEMAAGEVIFYSPRLFHGSGPNQGLQRRIAVGGGITPEHAQLQYSVAVSSGLAELFEVDSAFFWAYRAGERAPGYRSLGVANYSTAQLTEDDVAQSPKLRRTDA